MLHSFFIVVDDWHTHIDGASRSDTRVPSCRHRQRSHRRHRSCRKSVIVYASAMVFGDDCNHAMPAPHERLTTCRPVVSSRSNRLPRDGATKIIHRRPFGTPDARVGRTYLSSITFITDNGITITSLRERTSPTRQLHRTGTAPAQSRHRSCKLLGCNLVRPASYFDSSFWRVPVRPHDKFPAQTGMVMMHPVCNHDASDMQS